MHCFIIWSFLVCSFFWSFHWILPTGEKKMRCQEWDLLCIGFKVNWIKSLIAKKKEKASVNFHCSSLSWECEWMPILNYDRQAHLWQNTNVETHCEHLVGVIYKLTQQIDESLSSYSSPLCVWFYFVWRCFNRHKLNFREHNLVMIYYSLIRFLLPVEIYANFFRDHCIFFCYMRP